MMIDGKLYMQVKIYPTIRKNKNKKGLMLAITDMSL